ncbi:unnamed protein product, partial [Owenia fusiformis]
RKAKKQADLDESEDPEVNISLKEAEDNISLREKDVKRREIVVDAKEKLIDSLKKDIMNREKTLSIRETHVKEQKLGLEKRERALDQRETYLSLLDNETKKRANQTTKNKKTKSVPNKSQQGSSSGKFISRTVVMPMVDTSSSMLDTISINIKNKIWNNEFIEITKLFEDDSDEEMSSNVTEELVKNACLNQCKQRESNWSEREKLIMIEEVEGNLASFQGSFTGTSEGAAAKTKLFETISEHFMKECIVHRAPDAEISRESNTKNTLSEKISNQLTERYAGWLSNTYSLFLATTELVVEKFLKINVSQEELWNFFIKEIVRI